MPERIGELLADVTFFALNQGRKYRIRPPIDYEFEDEFRSLGPHAVNRRRVLVKRVEITRASQFKVRYARLPMLLSADESVENTDETVGQMFRKIIADAAKDAGNEVVF